VEINVEGRAPEDVGSSNCEVGVSPEDEAQMVDFQQSGRSDQTIPMKHF
jgi:hypothetical protein